MAIQKNIARQTQVYLFAKLECDSDILSHKITLFVALCLVCPDSQHPALGSVYLYDVCGSVGLVCRLERRSGKTGTTAVTLYWMGC